MTVMVPFSNVGNVGLRRITKTAEINKVLNYLSAGECAICPDWKCRFKINSDKMQSGNLLQVAEVLKCLLIVQSDKPLSFREKEDAGSRAAYGRFGDLDREGVLRDRCLGLAAKALAKASLTLPSAA